MRYPRYLAVIIFMCAGAVSARPFWHPLHLACPVWERMLDLQVIDINTRTGFFGRLLVKPAGADITRASLITNSDQKYGPTLEFYSFCFIDEKTGLANSSDGMVKTSDGGSTWYKVKAPKGMRFNYFKFFDKRNGVAGAAIIGEDEDIIGEGVILKTDDAGESWTMVAKNSSPAIWRLTFITKSVAYAIRENPKSTSIVKSVDGGKTWTQLVAGDKRDEFFTEVFFIDEKTGWISGDRSENKKEDAEGFHFIRHTTDGGKTWKEQLLKKKTPGRHEIFFVNRNDGCFFAADETGLRNVVYTTNNGGKTWTQGKSPDVESVFYNLHFIDAKKGYANFAHHRSQISEIFVTTDGGKTWKKEWQMPFHGTKMFVLNSNTFWVGGGPKLMKYTGK